MAKDYALLGRHAPARKPRAANDAPTGPAGQQRQPAGSVGGSPPAAGLSKPHIVTSQKPSTMGLAWYEGASLVEIRGPSRCEWSPPKSKRPRQKIQEWSASSRARFKQFMAKLNAEALSKAVLVTLTYPADFPAPEQFRIYKNHLRVFCQALARRYPNAAGVWKLEFQTRGAAHYHLVVLGLSGEPLADLRAWCSARWYELAHDGDRHQGKACCQVDPVKSKGGIMNYMGKYLSKSDQTRPGDFTGRYWGAFNKGKLPFGERRELDLAPEQLVKVRRWARKKIEADVNRARWNRFLHKDAPARLHGNRLYWETLKSVKHGGGRSLTWQQKEGGYWMKEDGRRLYVPPQWVISVSGVSLLQVCRPPRRWKMRRNDHIKLLCQPEVFVSALLRTFFTNDDESLGV